MVALTINTTWQDRLRDQLAAQTKPAYRATRRTDKVKVKRPAVVKSSTRDVYDTRTAGELAKMLGQTLSNDMQVLCHHASRLHKPNQNALCVGYHKRRKRSQWQLINGITIMTFRDVA